MNFQAHQKKFSQENSCPFVWLGSIFAVNSQVRYTKPQVRSALNCTPKRHTKKAPGHDLPLLAKHQTPNVLTHWSHHVARCISLCRALSLDRALPDFVRSSTMSLHHCSRSCSFRKSRALGQKRFYLRSRLYSSLCSPLVLPSVPLTHPPHMSYCSAGRSARDGRRARTPCAADAERARQLGALSDAACVDYE